VTYDCPFQQQLSSEKGATGMKLVAIRVLGTDREPLEFELSPGMTAGDLLAEADLPGFLLARQGEQHYLQLEEPLYDTLQDCEKLYAYPPVGGV
jgi:hypothetical protein